MKKKKETQSSAVKRGIEMLEIPLGSIPIEALFYLRHLHTKIGSCLEVYLSAWVTYAQIVEGLECDDDLYKITPQIKEWWNESQTMYEMVKKENGLLKIRMKG